MLARCARQEGTEGGGGRQPIASGRRGAEAGRVGRSGLSTHEGMPTLCQRGQPGGGRCDMEKATIWASNTQETKIEPKKTYKVTLIHARHTSLMPNKYDNFCGSKHEKSSMASSST